MYIYIYVYNYIELYIYICMYLYIYIYDSIISKSYYLINTIYRLVNYFRNTPFTPLRSSLGFMGRPAVVDLLRESGDVKADGNLICMVSLHT